MPGLGVARLNLLVPRDRIELSSQVFQTRAVTDLATSANFWRVSDSRRDLLGYPGFSGLARFRTWDLTDVNRTLYQLSYKPVCRERESNPHGGFYLHQILSLKRLPFRHPGHKVGFALLYGSGASIRTKINSSKGCCPTVRRHRNNS